MRGVRRKRKRRVRRERKEEEEERELEGGGQEGELGGGGRWRRRCVSSNESQPCGDAPCCTCIIFPVRKRK